jgi:surface protein
MLDGVAPEAMLTAAILSKENVQKVYKKGEESENGELEGLGVFTTTWLITKAIFRFQPFMATALVLSTALYAGCLSMSPVFANLGFRIIYKAASARGVKLVQFAYWTLFYGLSLFFLRFSMKFCFLSSRSALERDISHLLIRNKALNPRKMSTSALHRILQDDALEFRLFWYHVQNCIQFALVWPACGVVALVEVPKFGAILLGYAFAFTFIGVAQGIIAALLSTATTPIFATLGVSNAPAEIGLTEALNPDADGDGVNDFEQGGEIANNASLRACYVLDQAAKANFAGSRRKLFADVARTLILFLSPAFILFSGDYLVQEQRIDSEQIGYAFLFGALAQIALVNTLVSLAEMTMKTNVAGIHISRAIHLWETLPSKPDLSHEEKKSAKKGAKKQLRRLDTYASRPKTNFNLIVLPVIVVAATCFCVSIWMFSSRHDTISCEKIRANCTATMLNANIQAPGSVEMTLTSEFEPKSGCLFTLSDEAICRSCASVMQKRFVSSGEEAAKITVKFDEWTGGTRQIEQSYRLLTTSQTTSSPELVFSTSGAIQIIVPADSTPSQASSSTPSTGVTTVSRTEVDNVMARTFVPLFARSMTKQGKKKEARYAAKYSALFPEVAHGSARVVDRARPKAKPVRRTPLDHTSTTPGPDGWTCSSGWYDEASQNTTIWCDCECGIMDPDCDLDNAIQSCGVGEECAILSSSGVTACLLSSNSDYDFVDEALEEYFEDYSSSTSSLAVEAQGWTCNEYYFDADDGCDCNCGSLMDPDCLGEYTYIYGCSLEAGQTCGYAEIDGVIENTTSCINPTPGAVVDPIPAAWQIAQFYWECSDSRFGDGVCDCGCGYFDIDCDQTDSGALSYPNGIKGWDCFESPITNFDEIVNPFTCWWEGRMNGTIEYHNLTESAWYGASEDERSEMYFTYILNTGGPTSSEFWRDMYDNMTTSQCIPVEADFCYSGRPFLLSEIQDCMSMSGGNYECCMQDTCSFEIEASHDENGDMTANVSAKLSRQSRTATKNKGYFRHPFGTKNTRAVELAKNILSSTLSLALIGSSGIIGEPSFPHQSIRSSKSITSISSTPSAPPPPPLATWSATVAIMPECDFGCSSIDNSDDCVLECAWNVASATCSSLTSCDGIIDPSNLTSAQNNTEISVYENIWKVVEHKCEGLLSKSSNFTFDEDSIPPGWTSGDTALLLSTYGSCDGCHCYNGIHDPDCNLKESGLPMNGQRLFSADDGTTSEQSWTTHTCIAGKIVSRSFNEDCPCNTRSSQEETDACNYAGGYSRCECEFSANGSPDMQDYVALCQSWSYDAGHCDGAVSECISHKKSCSAFYSSYTDEIFESTLISRSEGDSGDEEGAWFARFARMQRAFSPFVADEAETCSDWENLPFNKTCEAFHCMGFGDGRCDDELNSEECGYDGGDCCVDTGSSICKDPAMKTEPIVALSDSNFRIAVVACLTEASSYDAGTYLNPIEDGLCYNYGNATGYGSMPEWDVSRVTDMSSMFNFATGFNGDISSWNVSSVTNMEGMFRYLFRFNGDISTWNVSSVKRMGQMFQGAEKFDIDLSLWNVSQVYDMQDMFYYAVNFNQPLNSWNTQSVKNMERMFSGASAFNQSLDSWDTQSVTDMNGMFSYSVNFNQALNSWNTQGVKNMERTFSGASAFNQSLDSWNTQSVTDMNGMFNYAVNFNQGLNSWNTQSVENMERMFSGASAFNQSLNSWDTQSVTDMSSMFNFATGFNQDISGWNVRKVEFMHRMFMNAELFNYDVIGAWRSIVAEDLETDGMFEDADTFCSEKYVCGQSNLNPFSEFNSY